MPAEAAVARRREVAFAVSAAALLTAAIWLPFWRVELTAPQYPHGLQMTAYGSEVRGDLREINIINHYVGMRHIDAVPAPEMRLFKPAMAVLVVLALAAPLARPLGRLAVLASGATPLVILVDLQRWLHRFGHDLDPTAPLRTPPFTPQVVGLSKIGNFESRAMVSWGFVAMVVAALLLYLGLRRPAPRRRVDRTSVPRVLRAALLVLVALPLGVAEPGAEPGRFGAGLQRAIDATPSGSTLVVPPGLYRGPIRIDRPLTVVAEAGAVIDGGGRGSVVEIHGSGVTLRGFAIRNGGRSVSAEPAGIKVVGDDHHVVGNVVTDVYFGIHLAAGRGNRVEANSVRPGEAGGVRPGHAISLWHQRAGLVAGNRVAEARDGIYMSFADDLRVERNVVTGCRYGIHSMYSQHSAIADNRLQNNLLGAALMYSAGLRMRCNRIERHRRGPTAYGVLLKDIDDLVMEANLIAGNRVGIYADGTPLGAGREAVVRGNLLYANHAALKLQSNVALTFYDNRLVGNLIDVRPAGRGLSAANRWSVDGRGNHWDTYAGYDADGDGTGDLPHRAEEVTLELIERRPLVTAFVYTPASLAVERAARLFPLFRPPPLLVDRSPQVAPAPLRCPESAP